jgi:hypothetical protein
MAIPRLSVLRVIASKLRRWCDEGVDIVEVTVIGGES